ncbi:flocculation protein FLO11 isoform X2 [Drosophila novamexicana]|uniref:flocculation protein FLO11 isoform X2 n=1 Tax=Drosophila novamexicana TaxID=47314 RepID=UPI0011E5B883|nr:flocculation protein FLO11 isoform X2 [Drosophila novamexicana]
MQSGSMAQKTEMQAKDQHTQHDLIGDDEVSELQRPPSFYQKVREQAERFASTRLGQFVIERADRALKLIEDTTKWSLPQDKNSSAVVLERPLPWASFLLLIVLLRLARIWVSLGALMIGNAPVSPTDMIYFIQTRRRKLRAIRVHGLRVMRHRQQETSSRTGCSYTQQLSQWLSRAICRPGVQRANSGRVLNLRDMEKPQQGNQLNHSVSKRPREEDSNPDHNLTIDEMLAKYANENSEDDSDFVPNPEDETTATSSSSSSSDSDSASHSSEQISSNEEQANAEQHKESMKPNKTNQNHVEKPKDQQTKPATVNGTTDKEQTEVAIAAKQEQWKSSPGHLSAAMMNTHLYNNTAAAANIEPASTPTPSNFPTDNEHDPEHEDPAPDSVNASDSDTDSSSTSTVCHKQQPQPEHTDTSTLIADTSNPNPEHPNVEIPTPASPDHPTVETLTPATSSEDIFYSPIGSPNNFNSCFANQPLLRNAIVNAAPTHSTPNSELEEIHSAGSELEEATRQCISLAHTVEQQDTPPVAKPFKQQQQQQQQQQRQFNHSHQRFRGRNRR